MTVNRSDRQVLVVTKGHTYDRNAFGAMLDSLDGITCTQVEQPAAQRHFAGEEPARWDAYVMYDMPGYEFSADHTSPPVLTDPPEDYRRDLLDLVASGHGFVFLHHALAGWPTWDDYADVMGGRFRFIRDPGHPDSGYRHGVTQHVEPAAPGHPVLEGLDGGFEIQDEVYLCEIHDAEITPLLVTDAELTDRTVWSAWNAVQGRRDDNDGWEHPRGSGVAAWVRDHPRSRIVYIQFGDGPAAFGNPGFRRLLANAVDWVSRRDTAGQGA
ncbi:ThuA domain-containing protein [Actinomadura sp. LD22]|uniref:ThuA domain-containing protein n=1 Tax=Actinomadura physcomitrii TaxID=2650748 RepID=A0A6I4MHQ6_9ACTN|nr:ThuA domain-containing protein [Actinomadura physcomitrii]MWA03211.1 ThuA domain-containing protein [Actinomadura physcomitrii]